MYKGRGQVASSERLCRYSRKHTKHVSADCEAEGQAVVDVVPTLEPEPKKFSEACRNLDVMVCQGNVDHDLLVPLAQLLEVV